MRNIKLKNGNIIQVPMGKPVMISWQAKNKERQGNYTAVGWIQAGEKPGSFTIVHSCFASRDEREYAAKWTVWQSQITGIKLLSSK